MKESIIITYHKNKDMLLYCLDRILKTTPNEVEILIIGNNINKSELDIDIPNSRCKYLKYPQNLQYPKALNLAVKQCDSEIITFVDSDIFVWDGESGCGIPGISDWSRSGSWNLCISGN